MDLNLTPQEQNFRDEVRAWLQANVPQDWESRRAKDDLRDFFASCAPGRSRSSKPAGRVCRGRKHMAAAAPPSWSR